MKRFKTALFYMAVIGGFSAIMLAIIQSGTLLQAGRNIVVNQSENSQWQDFIDSFAQNIQHPLALLLAQIVSIIIAAKLFGWICTKIGQPSVIGEMIAGIVLGPSLIGSYFPEFSVLLFPTHSLPNLQFLSQIGLILFMFIIGMELDLKLLNKASHDAVVISHASIIVPFSLGMGLAYYIYQSYAPDGIPFLSFGLFMGIAMSITAFPVLARIIQERGITKTKLGAIAITCAAADDITAWCILAAVIAIVKAGSVMSSLYTIGMAVGYVLLMIKVVRPFLARIGSIYNSKESLTKPIVALFFLTLIISAYVTEVIGIHALFGAFMAGAIMPDNMKFRSLFIEKVEDVSLVLLLPLFFVFTGLRTQINLINGTEQWVLTGLIIALAVAGKFLSSTLAAKFVGQNWKDSLSIGALMNTRGLTELIVLNIGYDLGVLTPTVFSMLVLMALVTTIMTGPALDVINRLFSSNTPENKAEASETSKYKILVSFGNPENGKSLLRLANGLTRRMNGRAAITAMHITPNSEIHPTSAEAYETESFAPIIQEAKNLNQQVTALYKSSNDIEAEIVEVANKGKYDLLLIGVGQSIYEGSLLGKILGFTSKIINPEKLINQVTGKESLFENEPFDDRTQTILAKSKISVGVFVNKGFSKMDHIFIPIFSEQDIYLIPFAQRLIKNADSQITLLDAIDPLNPNATIIALIQNIEQTVPNLIKLVHEGNIDQELLKQKDLMIISANSWKKWVATKSVWLSDIPSTLILSDKRSGTINP